MIAKTGNKIVDAQARRGAAEAKLSESRKAAAARKAAKAGKAGKRAATAKSRKVSGKSAAGRGGRGIVIKKSKSGKGFGGLLKYMTTDPAAKPILSNCGDTPDQQARFMRTCAEQNPKVKKPVGHLIAALPEGVKKSAKDWQKIVGHITEEMGLSDHPFAAVLHETEKGQDLHICYSRVDLNGNVYNDSNDKYLMSAVEQSSEQKFNLRLVPYSEMKSRKADTPDVPLGEVRQAERTGLKPPRLAVSDAIKEAKQNKPTPQEFIKRLASAGVVATPYVHNSEVKGFSFSQDGVSYKGKDVGASWTKLEMELDYVETRDLEPLADLSRQARADTSGIEPAAVPTPRPTVEVLEPSRPVELAANEVKKPAAKEPAKATELARPSTVSPSVDDDPIAKKVKARQALIDKLRMETGEKHKLANELADRLERGDLYRQREAINAFIADHHRDPHAIAIVKTHLPDAVPITAAPAAPAIQSAESRARVEAAMNKLKADQAARDAIRAKATPTYAAPSRDQTDYQFPTM